METPTGMLRFAARAMFWLLPFLAYAAAPFATAWTIREAVKSGDAPFLERAIAWDSVRSTLRSSMKHVALDVPMRDGLNGDIASVTSSRGWWQRFKGSMGETAVDRMIDSYATPEGLPSLFQYRKMYRTYVAGEGEPDKSISARIGRMIAFWSRVRHAQFHSATAFEIEVADKADPTRRYTGLLTLSNWRWQLTELYVHTTENPLGRLAALHAARNPLER